MAQLFAVHPDNPQVRLLRQAAQLIGAATRLSAMRC